MKAMIDQACITRKIFTQASRQVTENDSYRIAVTDFGPLKIYEYTIAAGKLVWLRPTTGLVIPVSGSLEVNHALLTPGEALRFTSQEMEVFNPYDKELVNFLVIENIAVTHQPPGDEELGGFDINSFFNELVRIADGLYIGKFSGRQDYTYQKYPSASKMILYVIEGAFEASECLLEDRDGLMVEGSSSCDWEALSNGAIMLVAEV